jgi:Rieske Fe-S protein
VFISPHHGERFNLVGEPLSGPAMRGLWRCPVSIEDGDVTVDVPAGTNQADIEDYCRL